MSDLMKAPSLLVTYTQVDFYVSIFIKFIVSYFSCYFTKAEVQKILARLHLDSDPSFAKNISHCYTSQCSPFMISFEKHINLSYMMKHKSLPHLIETLTSWKFLYSGGICIRR